MLEYNNGILYSVDPTSLSSYSLGSVPQNTLSIFGFGVGNDMLLSDFTLNENSILFTNVSQPNSLVTSYSSTTQPLEPIPLTEAQW